MVCSIDWNPTQQDEIAFIKVDGYWGTVANFLKDAPIKTATAVPETEKNVRILLFLILKLSKNFGFVFFKVHICLGNN